MKKKSISERAIIGFDHGLPCRVKNMALGPQLRQNPRPSATVFVYWVPRAMFFTRHGTPWSNPTARTFWSWALYYYSDLTLCRKPFSQWLRHVVVLKGSGASHALHSVAMRCWCSDKTLCHNVPRITVFVTTLAANDTSLCQSQQSTLSNGRALVTGLPIK